MKNIGVCVHCSEKDKKKPNCKNVRSCPFYEPKIKCKTKKMNKIVDYKNGNVDITIYADGTKVMEYDETKPVVFDFPTSMDVKITNKCMGVPSGYGLGDFKPCQFCHEKSSPNGKHCDMEALKKVLDVLPGGQELALGGGNPLSHPDLYSFLEWCQIKKFIPNLTMNFYHLDKYSIVLQRLIHEKMIYGLGISIPTDGIRVTSDSDEHLLRYPNTVAHLIIGLHQPSVIKDLKTGFGVTKFLLLGYKEFGNGKSYYKKNKDAIDNNIAEWDEKITSLITGNGIISFDNLSIEQLNMQSKLPKGIWDNSYMGTDFSNTMYMDAVEEEYAPTSRSPKEERVRWKNMDLKEYFNKYKNQFA
jgi:hypothetical protein